MFFRIQNIGSSITQDSTLNFKYQESHVRTAHDSRCRATRTRHRGQDRQYRTAGKDSRSSNNGRIAITGKSWDRTTKTAQLRQDIHHRTAVREKPGQDNSDKTAKTGQSGQASRVLSAWIRQEWRGWAEHDSKDRATRTGQLGQVNCCRQDSVDGIVRTGQLRHVSLDRVAWKVSLDISDWAEREDKMDSDSKDMSAMTGIQDRTIGTGQ
jgi:hypothetical protein